MVRSKYMRLKLSNLPESVVQKYIPRQVPMCTYPSLVAFASRLYFCTTLSGRLLSLSHMYLLRTMGVFK